MFKSAGLEENTKEEAPTKESDGSSEQKVTFVDEDEDELREDEEADHEDVVLEEKKPLKDDDVDEREEESDEDERPMKDPYSDSLGSTMQGGKPDFGQFNDLEDDDERDEPEQPDFNEYKADNQETKADDSTPTNNQEI